MIIATCITASAAQSDGLPTVNSTTPPRRFSQYAQNSYALSRNGMNQQQPFYQANQQANGQFGQRQFGYNFQNPHGYDPEQGAYNNFGYQQNHQYPGSAGGYQPQTGFMGQFNDQFANQQRSPQNGVPYGPPNMQHNSNNYGPQQPSQYAGQQHPSMGYNGQKSLTPSSDFGYTNYHDQQRQQFFGPTRGSYGSVSWRLAENRQRLDYAL